MTDEWILEKLTCSEENAETYAKWLAERGGLAVWPSVDLSDLGVSWTTPALQLDGTPTPKPHWKASDRPQIITDPEKVVISRDEEVKRFHVAVRQGGNGLKYKLTEGGSRKVRHAVARAGDDAYYVFDYETQEAVIMKPMNTISLKQWLIAKSYETTDFLKAKTGMTT